MAVRRLVSEYKLTRMWTLTLRAATTPEDRPVVVRLLQAALRKLRERDSKLIYLAVLEWHPKGHGWHVHLLTHKFVPKAVVQSCWTHGFVDARRIAVNGDSTSRSAVSKAASYVAKYVSKAPPEGAPPHLRGENRYFRPIGLCVVEIEAEGEFGDLYAVAIGYFSTGIGWEWWSATCPEWRGPPCVVMRSK